MSYSSLGAGLVFSPSSSLTLAPAPGSAAGYPVADRASLVNGLRGAAIILRGRAGARTTSAQQIAMRDSTLLNNTAAWINALRPAPNGLIPSRPIWSLLNGLIIQRPSLRAEIDRQLTFRGGPSLASRMAALTAPAPAPAPRFVPVATTRPLQTSPASVPVTTMTAINTAAKEGTPSEVACSDGYFRDPTGVCVVRSVVPATTAAPPNVSAQSVPNQGGGITERYAEPAADPSADMAELFGGETPSAPSEVATDQPAVVAPAAQTGVMAKLDAVGPLGMKWKFWGLGAIAAAAGGGYLVTRKKKSVTPNRRHSHRRRS